MSRGFARAMTRNRDRRDALTRRGALATLAGAGTTLALACGRASNGGNAPSRAANSAALRDPPTLQCAVTPGGEIGPYFADDSAAGFFRSNVLANIDGSNVQSGILLALTITIVDARKGCVPYAGAQVDLWHCNAAGVYSDQASEQTASDSWLRGYQLTDARGQVTFTTIVPGWYRGRTTHIHVRVRSNSGDCSDPRDGSNTTQLFFEQTLVDELAMSVAPYNAQGKNSLTNATDRVFAEETRGANVLALSGQAQVGYRAAVTIGVPLTDSGTRMDGRGPGRGPAPEPAGHESKMGPASGGPS